MKETSVVMAGFGGQGVMSIGKILAKAAIHEGKEVTWLPSYGPEMRGGTANCTVVIADGPIGSPLVKFPD
ncbi:MAG: 2-oxoacid:acceptor oxidoreductase family protein, partial [Thermoguttaceae bacterium]|nr:2-oxoacid:acceptor oxidoreductase family protein [Thermoguttaceae bacterium]